MSSIYDELSKKGQSRYNGIRRKVQFFATFAGGVIEALRESGFRLCSFDKQPEQLSQLAAGSGHGHSRLNQSNGNIELFFEQEDRDQCKVLIVPYRTDLPFLYKGRFVAQLGLELSRYCNDPDTLRQAVSVNARSAFGSMLGRARLPKLYLDSPPDIKPPGTMTFELRGARLVVSMNILANLGKYRLTDMELDIDAIREDLQVYFYGLEKYLALLMQNFGGKVDIQGSDDELDPPVEEPEASEILDSLEQHAAILPQSLPPSGTVPLVPPMPPTAGAPLPPHFPLD